MSEVREIDQNDPIEKFVGNILSFALSKVYHAVSLSLEGNVFVMDFYRREKEARSRTAWFRPRQAAKYVYNKVHTQRNETTDPHLLSRTYIKLLEMDEYHHSPPRQYVGYWFKDPKEDDMRLYAAHFTFENDVIWIKFFRILDTRKGVENEAKKQPV